MIKKTLILSLYLFSLPLIANEVIKSVSYQWLTMGKPSGAQKVTYFKDGRVDSEFSFTDRGRGPNTKESIWLNKQGLIVKQKISGNSYMGSPVDEVFSLVKDQASWKNTQESQSVSNAQNKFYLAADGVPQDLEFLVKAIDKSSSKMLSLLPSGTAQYHNLLTTQIESEKGELKEVSLIAITGLGFGPSYAWFDKELNLFALTYGWMAMAPEGWATNLNKLYDLQTKSNSDYYKSLATKYSQKLTGVTLFTNINVYTATNQGLIKDTEVAIKDGTIVAIGQETNALKVEKTIDGKGRTLMPGLWDMHTHISIDDGILNIVNGVTSVRDLANKHEDVMQATKLFDSGEAIGPSIYRAGFIDQKSPFSAPTGKLATNLEEALAFVDWYAERGYQQIKIYSSITPAWVKPIAERIHKHGMKLSGHIPSYMTAEQAVKDGFDEIQHINMLFLNFLADKDDDTRTPVRFTLVGEKAGELDLNSKVVNDFVKLLKQKDVIVDPTLTIFQSMFINKAGEVDPGYMKVVDHLPANVARGFLSSELEINADNEKQYAASSEAILKMTKKLFDAGIRIVAGTDAIAGYTLHRELELYTLAGIPNNDVLKIATVNAARIAGQKNVGTVELGQHADLILVDGNPLENINAIRKVALIIKGGQLFDANEINRAIGIKPFVSD
jgi:imidazolonepropionase-like amidohydrolase